MVRTWNKNGHPTWVEPMTEEELDEMDLWAMNGIKPWASVPPGTDTTNMTPMVYPHVTAKLKKLTKLEPF